MVKIPERLKNMGVAMFGQGLNFIAMLLPVLGKEAGQLAYLMFPLALAALLFKIGSLSFHVRYLTLSDSKREIGTAVSMMGLVVVSILTAAVGTVVWAWSPHWGQVLVWSGLLTFSHGLFYMAVAVVITEKREAFYGRVRLVYGILNFLLTAIVVWVLPFQAGLIMVAFLITFVAGIWMIMRCENNLFAPLWRSGGQCFHAQGRQYVRESTRTTSAVFISDIGFQIQGFLTPLMGSYQEVWAIVVRLSGGFGTVGQQIIAPFFETKMAASIRDDDVQTAESTALKAQMTGIALALATIPIQIGAIIFAVDGPIEDASLVYIFISIYAFGLLASSTNIKAPYILGHEKAMVAWSIVRFITELPLLLTQGLILLALVSGVQIAVAIALVPLSIKAKQPPASTHF
ncbi:hypothetical protein PAB09_09395 [Corynebacterium sp. SCR221107]|uniref:hypothetical protein n=1 Tax=Corynebacterium sp. SCR221107 TaxID=3017361 RepID=UPI0022EC5860|nr:hypothetical protein [Corynebacterium sp. SCR221107]WBT08107.1 hypothetical protein PAB09_09395 [Corynebacterium sp. SCR221107]